MLFVLLVFAMCSFVSVLMYFWRVELVFFEFKLKALSVFKSNECSEDSCIGLGDFFCLFVFRKKSENLFKFNFNFSRFDL